MFDLKNLREEKYIHIIFDISVILKGVHAFIEIVGGIFVLLVSKEFVQNAVTWFTQGELADDPQDFISNYFVGLAQNFSVTSQHFVAFYLLSHGIIKGFLVLALLKEKLWAYPLAIIVFSIFSIYQIFRFTHTHSVWLLLITLLDFAVIGLTWHEYKYMKARPARA